MNRTSRRHKLLLISGIITAGAVALAGCSSSKASTSAGAKPGQVTLVVYSAQGYDHAMTAAFTKATGIPVKLDDNSTGPLLTQIEASRNNPNWGLLWVDGATAFAGLDQQGLLQKGFEPSVKWDTLGQQSLPSDKSYMPTGVTLMATMVYDKTKVTSPPSTWQQLLSSAYKGEVGMNDPSQSWRGNGCAWRSFRNCQPGRYYLLNNYDEGYNINGTVNTPPYTLPPQKTDYTTSGNELSAHHISWGYHGEGYSPDFAAIRLPRYAEPAGAARAPVINDLQR